MKEYIFVPRGVCANKFEFLIENNILLDLKIVNGCPGYSTGIVKLLKGMNIDDIIKKLKGTRCGFKSTSCPDQLAIALEEYKKNN